MNERDVFLKAIVNRPDDLAPRLAFADWLEEQGDEESRARAEFIRLDHALDQMSETDPRRDATYERALELTEQHGPDWYPELLQFVWQINQYRSGFPFSVTVPASNFVKHCVRMFQLAPIQEIRVLAVRREIAKLVNCTELSSIRRLSFEATGSVTINASEARLLAGCRHLSNLEMLNLRHERARPEGATALFQSQHLKRLRHLDLTGNSIGNRGVIPEPRPHSLDQLTILCLGDNGITTKGVEALVSSPALSHLEVLDLHSNVRIGNAGLRAIASSHWRGLRSLDLINTGITLEGAEALASSPVLQNITDLRLSNNELGPGVVDALLRSPNLGPLRRLELSGCSLDTSAVRALAESPKLTNLEILRIGFNNLSKPAADALLQSPYLENLTQLEVTKASFSQQSIRQLRKRFEDVWAW